MLEKYNFGCYFINWVKILYTAALLCMSNNVYNSNFFNVQRGVRQGCPISALLFLLVVEAMADKIRMSDDVHGITVSGYTITLSQLADDTTLFVKDKQSLSHAITILSHFEKCAGLKLNTDKSEIIVLDKNVSNNYVCGMPVVKKSIKVLGVWITNNVEDIPTINLNERLEKVKHLLNMWRQRHLSLKGKVTIINSLALSQLMYICSVVHIPTEFIDEVNDLVKSFIWPKKVHIKHQTIIAPICEGGLRLPDFRCKVKACKATWVKRILNSDKLSHFVRIFGLPLPFKEMCMFNYNIKYLEDYKSSFYAQILKYWYELQVKTVKTVKDIRTQSIWYNINITINGNPIFNRQLYNRSLVYINDIIDENGRFLSLDDVKQKFDTNMCFMLYNSIKDAIPNTWKKG